MLGPFDKIIKWRDHFCLVVSRYPSDSSRFSWAWWDNHFANQYLWGSNIGGYEIHAIEAADRAMTKAIARRKARYGR